MIKPQFINLFPLTLYKARIELSESQKKEMISEILEIRNSSQSENKPTGTAWAGFTHKNQDLFDNDKFKFFFVNSQKAHTLFLAHLLTSTLFLARLLKNTLFFLAAPGSCVGGSDRVGSGRPHPTPPHKVFFEF